MLDIAPDKVAEIAILARNLTRNGPEIEAFIDALSQEEQAALVALFWIGRGTFEPEELEEAVETAHAEATVSTSEYLLDSPHLADHLESGLSLLGMDARVLEDALY